MTTKLIFIFVLMTFIHTINTSAFAARLAGVRTGHPALASSLYNVLALSARVANALAVPLIASITDLAESNQNMTELLSVYRLVLFAAPLGTIIAALLIPTLSRVLARGVDSYEMRQSLPRVVVHGTSVQGLWRIRHEVAAPRIGVLRELRHSPFPKRFLVASIIATAITTVSSTAATYASALIPEGARTATSLSPIIAGISLVLNVFLISPMAALVTDEALKDKRPLKDVTYITVWQVGAQFIGTLSAQAILLPASWGIVIITRWLIY